MDNYNWHFVVVNILPLPSDRFCENFFCVLAQSAQIQTERFKTRRFCAEEFGLVHEKSGIGAGYARFLTLWIPRFVVVLQKDPPEHEVVLEIRVPRSLFSEKEKYLRNLNMWQSVESIQMVRFQIIFSMPEVWSVANRS